MLSLRFLRRRGFGLLWKSVLIFGLLLIFIQMTSSHPRGGNFKPDAIKEVVQVGENKVIEVPNPKVQQPKEDILQELQAGLKLSNVPTVPPKLDRKVEPQLFEVQGLQNEFYENILVHFDLKGAPPKVPYFKQLLKLVRDSGATGILLEWEDMFPWEGRLKTARNSDAYSMEDVKAILNEAKALNLDVIPLMQTFGHLEWFLKLEEFQHLRENPAYPQVLCLGDQEGVDLVKDAIRQIVQAHKPYGIPFFHIGADEAFEFGVCKKSLEWITSHGSQGGKQLLALTHLKNIALFAKEAIGQDTTVLAWHDMLKDFDGQLIKQLQLGSVVQPVVWDYSENIVTMPDMSFSLIAENFPIIWASSAYKGANFPSAKYIDIAHYEKNNLEWIRTKQRQAQKFKKFGGIIITGWQRYDHMAAVCEILPIGTPSMVLQIRTAINAPALDQQKNRQEAAKLLECPQYEVQGLNLVSNTCKFPGWSVYQQFQGTAQQTIRYVESEIDKNHHLMGWLSPYSMQKNVSQNWYLSQIESFLLQFLSQMDMTEDHIRKEMQHLFFDNTIDEFLFITVGQTTDKLRTWLNECRRLSKLRTFPKRHFPIKRVKEL